MSLKAGIAYKQGATNLPIVVIMHGFSGAASAITATVRNRYAHNNVFVVVPEMRGRGTAGGDEDCSAREIYDIYDAVEYVKANYSDVVNPNQIHLVGYSGGGGNAFACAAKFPDYFNTIISFFGMSDYGHDSEDGWYQNGAGETYQPTLESWIGDNPTNVPNAYHARAHVLGMANYSGGHLFIFHDEDDTTVPVINSSNVKDILDGAGLSNYTYNISKAGDPFRWLHGYPAEIPALIVAEPIFINPIVAETYSAWTVTASGTVTVLGYIKTKRFTIWLGGLTEAAAGAGLDEVAIVAYNTVTGQYTVTPLTGNMDVFIKQGELTASQSITEESILTVS